jgi:p-hydroxybenzoate 3-monooxygenase
MTDNQIECPVAIVGAGPAGLMLAHLLERRGISTIAIDNRTRHEIETTHRAGILEADVVRMLIDTGVSDRVIRDGFEHEGIELRFAGRGHRIDFRRLVGESDWLYPQQEVFIDLADARARDGGDVRFGVTDVAVTDHTIAPVVRFTDSDGVTHEVRCAVVVGADGSHSYCRNLVPASERRQFTRTYPFAWLGILAEAPMSAPELIYANSPRGFALISQRTPSVQRMYLQCAPDEDLAKWPDDRIWSELVARTAGDGLELQTGPIFEKTVLGFRSFVQETMRHGRLVLAGDAAHTVPPTGAKGLNLAFADVRVLAGVIERALGTADFEVLGEYPPAALNRIWKAESFSYWMTQMLHLPPEGVSFDSQRQLGELRSIVESERGSAYLAECYTGWPTPR